MEKYRILGLVHTQNEFESLYNDFVGTYKECVDFITKQGVDGFKYKIVSIPIALER